MSPFLQRTRFVELIHLSIYIDVRLQPNLQRRPCRWISSSISDRYTGLLMMMISGLSSRSAAGDITRLTDFGVYKPWRLG